MVIRQNVGIEWIVNTDSVKDFPRRGEGCDVSVDEEFSGPTEDEAQEVHGDVRQRWQ